MLSMNLEGRAARPEEVGVRYYDRDGQERDEAWVKKMFGEQVLYIPNIEPPYFRLGSLKQSRDDLRLVVTIHDERGEPCGGVDVGVKGKINPAPVTVRTTNEHGIAIFNLDDYSFRYSAVDQIGPYILGLMDRPGDIWESLGIVRGRSRGDWLNPTFVFVSDQGTGPDFEEKVIDKLQSIYEMLDEMLCLIKGQWE